MRGLSRHVIGVIGLGYVGLPLAVEFGKKYRTIGFDNNPGRIKELQAGRDSTREATRAELEAARKLRFSAQAKALRSCSVYIVTVPTPIDQYKRPDLNPLLKASETVGRVLKKGDVVIYESTVYPGCTEEICVPVLERFSSLRFNKDFYCGYSPERINPGDKQHRLVHHQEGDLRLDAADRRLRQCAVRIDHHGGHASGIVHQGGRSRQGDREHPARCQHRAHQ